MTQLARCSLSLTSVSSAELSEGLHLSCLSCWAPSVSPRQRGRSSASKWCQMMIWYPVIPQRTDFMAQFSCSAAQDLFYNDKDNIGQAIIILWPNTWKWYIFMVLCHLIFQPPGLNVSLSFSFFLIKRLSTCHFNLVFSLPESLSVSLVDPFTWQILSCPLQRAKGCTAAEHHLRWEACYLNLRSRVPCLPFSWLLTVDPDWCSPHAEANSAVKRTHFPTLDSHF